MKPPIDRDTPNSDIAERITAAFQAYGLEPTPDGWRDFAVGLILDLSAAAREGDKGLRASALLAMLKIDMAVAPPPKVSIAAEHHRRMLLMARLTAEIEPRTGELRKANAAARLAIKELEDFDRDWGGNGDAGIAANSLASAYSADRNAFFRDNPDATDDAYPPTTDRVVTAIVDAGFHSAMLRRVRDVARAISSGFPHERTRSVQHVGTLKTAELDSVQIPTQET